MKKILVPTDFSENAYNALKYGVKLFAEEECVFHLLNTYSPAIYNSEYMVYSNVSIEEIYRLNSLKSLSNVVKRIKKENLNAKHSYKKIASFNLLQDEIKSQVKKKGIDLVIMGTQGASNTAQMILGTHTVHAIKGAVCPLLAVPANFEFTTPKNILFPSDFESDMNMENVEIINNIAQKFQAKIHILHIMRADSLNPDQKRNKEELGVILTDTMHKFHMVKNESMLEGIYNFQENNSFDLLVMVKYKHSFFKNLFFPSVVNKIGFQLKTPFLVIPVIKKKINHLNHEKDSFTHRFFM